MKVKPSTDKACVAIAAAGTGGHILPGVAVGEACEALGLSVVWIGRDAPLEQRLIPKPWPQCHVVMKGFFGKGVLRWLALPWVLLRACWAVMRFLREHRPQALLVMGGYVSVPAGIVARCMGLALVVHEQNRVMGRANRLLHAIAHKTYSGWPLRQGYKTQVIGNPIRSHLKHARRDRDVPHQPLRCLVLGGSQGAAVLNRCVIDAWLATPPEQRPHMMHQVGDKHLACCLDRLGSIDEACDYQLRPFIDDMADAYAWADVMIARAGALTVAESEAIGLPTLWVPLPGAVDNHQTWNALHHVNLGLGRLCPQGDSLTEAILAWWAAPTQVALADQATAHWEAAHTLSLSLQKLAMAYLSQHP